MMKKIGFFFKNMIYLLFFVLCTVFFVALRVFQLFSLTDLNTGVCYEFRIFEYVFLFGSLLFLVFSYLFFRFFRRFELVSLNNMQKSVFLGFVGFLSSIIVLVCSFVVLFRTTSAESISSIFNILFFVIGVFFAICFIWLSGCFCRGKGIKNSAIMFFVSAFLWVSVRLLSFMCTESIFVFDRVEYQLMVLETLSLFLFLFYFGGSILGLYSENGNLNFGLASWGFCSIFVVCLSVLPRLILRFKLLFYGDKVFSSYFKKNLDFFNVYNFSLVDFAVVLFAACFLISNMIRFRENSSNETALNEKNSSVEL